MTRPLFTPPNLYDSARWSGRRIGLLGGTFNPPHYGHVFLATCALRWLKLDAIWWCVSPGHSLKPHDRHTFPDRLAQSQKFVHHPRIIVTDIEKRLGTTSTAALADGLKRRYPRTDFIFIGGFDLAAQLRRWCRWRHLLNIMPLAIIARPPAQQLVTRQAVGRLNTLPHTHLNTPGCVPLTPGISWIRRTPLHDISSTQIRARDRSRQRDCIDGAE
ncbi:MAG: nicotinate-nicotinamide nucleotide adenylyltransferase [Pseudomonadota bacterium]